MNREHNMNLEHNQNTYNYLNKEHNLQSKRRQSEMAKMADTALDLLARHGNAVMVVKRETNIPGSVGLYVGNGHFVVSNAALLLVLFAAVVITIVCWYIPAMLIVGAVIVVLALIWKV